MDTATRTIEVDKFFDLEAILDGTQDFRWHPWTDEHSQVWQSGVLKGHLIHLRQVEGTLEYSASEGADVAKLLRFYFRLDEDTEAMRPDITVDATLGRLANRYPYLRILRQPDPWQATVSYICSASNRIERISASVENIACALGDRRELNGEVRLTFPPPERVLEAGETKLANCTRGFKSLPERILDAAQKECDGTLNLDRLRDSHVPYAEAAAHLKGVKGIGPKIADCIALFALDKGKAFPVDIWVERALAYYYPGQAPAEVRKRLGEHAGYASQLLFRDSLTRRAILTRPAKG